MRAQWVYGPDLCYTPLHFAVVNALPDIMRVLFKYNCDVLLRTPAGEIAKVRLFVRSFVLRRRHARQHVR